MEGRERIDRREELMIVDETDRGVERRLIFLGGSGSSGELRKGWRFVEHMVGVKVFRKSMKLKEG